MKRNRLQKLPLHRKLLAYFLIFGTIILVILWVFQSFFIKPLYVFSKGATIEKAAKTVTRADKYDKNAKITADNVALKYGLSVYLYHISVVKPTEWCKHSYEPPAARLYVEDSDVLHYYEKTVDAGGKCTFFASNDVGKVRRRREAILSESHGSSNDEMNPNYYLKTAGENESMVYASVYERNDGAKSFLLVTSSVVPLNTMMEVIRNQMILVSIIFILLSLAFSVYASRRIARPIAQTNEAAKELAKKNYAVAFDARGYREVEELNETLDYAKTELAAAEKLQRELIANISHDLRTPLTMITGYGEVMRDLPGENTPENIQIIIDEATRLSTLVNDLLDLSKLQSGAMPAQKKVYNLTESINAIFDRYSKLIEQDGFDIIFNYSEDVYIDADELRISQVLYNLINNAVNHVGEDKTVIITQIAKGKSVRIEVTDHGEGIPADKLPYIWDRYYKVDKEHKRGVIGSGLGLSIVKNILDAHNARYGVRSTPGKGSTFWFVISAVSIRKPKTPKSDGKENGEAT